MRMVYDESYGELSYAQRAAYKKFNVSPSDHRDLIERFGEDNHAQITACVKNPEFHSGGMFSAFALWNYA